MDIKISEKDLNNVLDYLHELWLIARDDLGYDIANDICRIRDKILLPQFNKQRTINIKKV